MPYEKQRNPSDIIGYDVSPNANDPKILCVACSDQEGDMHGSDVFAGDEWGAPVLPCCCVCGDEISDLTLVTP